MYIYKMHKYISNISPYEVRLEIKKEIYIPIEISISCLHKRRVLNFIQPAIRQMAL